MPHEGCQPAPQGSAAAAGASEGHPLFGARFSIRIHTEILVGDQRYVGLLWDVSRSGACVRSFEKVPARQNVLIRFHDPSRTEVIERTGRLIWVDLVMKAYYAGMSFDQPIDSHNTFLSRLLEISPPTPDRRAGEKSSRY